MSESVKHEFEITGGPAFPHTEHTAMGEYGGLTKRDYFAAMAMQEFMRVYVPLERVEPTVEAKMMTIATASYQMADCMLKAREAQ